jgi:kynurenine formamidase
MNRRLEYMLVGGLFLTGGLTITGLYPQSQSTATSVMPADYIRWRSEFKNWGRWGVDDERGTTNLITLEKVVSAVKLVKTGQVVSLAHAVPQQAAADVPEAAVFHRTTLGIDANATRDNYQVSYHGQATAHMDTFCHQFADGQMYNGFSVKENVTPEAGCKKGSVMAWRDGVVTRAVLYDIPQLKGVDWIEPGTPITRADLEAWEKKAGVKAGSGDVVLLYVGRWKRRAKFGPWGDKVAGYFVDTLPWVKQREPAFLGHDFNIDWLPRPGWGPDQGIQGNPIHQMILKYIGVNIVENLDLERVVETARRLRRYEFMITFAPLPVEGGTGSPLNPLAIF